MTQGEGTEWLKCPHCSGMGVRVLGDEEHRLQCIQCGRFRTYSPLKVEATPNQRSTE